jgi:hypothetical protein
MAKNDVVLIDAIIDGLIASQAPRDQDRGSVFESFAIAELLKDYDLSAEELEAGQTDGRHDAGVDGFYIFVNGHLLQDADAFVWPKSNASIELWLISSKHHATFAQATIDALLASIQELLDLARSASELVGVYSQEIQEARELFLAAYRRTALLSPQLVINVCYVSRGDVDELGESVEARARQVESLVGDLFSSAKVAFRFVGAKELVRLHRQKRKFALSLPFVERISTAQDSHVVLARLDAYAKFVTDERGQLRRYLFDSNVRDFLNESGVNQDIANSLSDSSAPDFWWMNNGVTILATKATVPGKIIEMSDIQIVNGLQTTETIYRHFQNSRAPDTRSVLLKIIVSNDPKVRDEIIKATNNQSPVELSSLHATDKIQRDIEQILEKHDWYYERRKNYYRNIGKPANRTVTPSYVAGAVVALIYKNPARASRLKTKFMRNAVTYNAIFSEQYPIGLWPVLVGVYKRTEQALAELTRGTKGRGERFLRANRGIFALLAVGKLLGTLDYSHQQLLSVDTNAVTDELVLKLWTAAEAHWREADRYGRLKEGGIKGLCESVAHTLQIDGVAALMRRQVPTGAPPVRRAAAVLKREPAPLRVRLESALKKRAVADAEVFEKVDGALPPQPWPKGIHREVAAKLGISNAEVQTAIFALIRQGRRYHQIDGQLFDLSGASVELGEETAPD